MMYQSCLTPSPLSALSQYRIHFENFIQRCKPFKIKKDFKSIRATDFHAFPSGHIILHTFHGFVPFLRAGYPSLRWDFFDVDRVSNAYWHNAENIKFFMEIIFRDYPEIFRAEDCKVVDTRAIKERCGGALLNGKESVLEILDRVFPEFGWNKMENCSGEVKQRGVVDRFVVEMEFVRRQEDLRRLNSRDFLDHPVGSSMMGCHEGSCESVLSHAYPELVASDGVSVYQDVQKKRIFVDKFLNILNVESQEELGEVPVGVFFEYPGGKTIVQYHNGSPSLIFQQVYPELTPQYKKNYHGYWKTMNHFDLLFKAMQHYDIQTKEDWYRLSIHQFSLIFGKAVPKLNLIKLLHNWHPEEDWEHSKFSNRINKRSREKYLGLQLRNLFKNEVIIENYVVKTDKNNVVFDYFIPGRKLVIEYQGEQHYFMVLKWSSWEGQKIRDTQKALLCVNNQLKLINIPYWWDNSPSSLKDIIQQQT